MMLELLVWWLCVFVTAVASERTFSFTLISSNSTPGVLPAVQSAVEQLNSNHTLNFTLELVSKHVEVIWNLYSYGQSIFSS